MRKCPMCDSTEIVVDYGKVSGLSCLHCNHEIKTNDTECQESDLSDIDLDTTYTLDYWKMIECNQDGWLRNRNKVNIK